MILKYTLCFCMSWALLQFAPAVQAIHLNPTDGFFQRPQVHSPCRYDLYSSDELQFAYFRIFKCATGTLTHFFRDQAPDLKQSHPSSVPPVIKKYYKFGFVRNTWDRIVSVYFHKVLTQADSAFSDCFGKDFDFFVDYINKKDLRHANVHIRPQNLLFPYKECDFIGRMDHFEEDLRHICNHLGLEMLHISHKHQTEHKHYSTYYNYRTKKIIEKKYRTEIKLFNFKFEKV